MRIIMATVGILAMTVLLGGRAEAKDLVLESGAFYFAGAGDLATCAAVNVGKKPFTVAIEIIGPGGTATGTNGCMVDPEHECHFDGSSIVNTGFAHCRLTVTGGKKNDVRATFCNLTQSLCTDVR